MIKAFVIRTFLLLYILCCYMLTAQCQRTALPEYKLDPRQLDSLIFMAQQPQLIPQHNIPFSEKTVTKNELKININSTPRSQSLTSTQNVTCYDSSGRFFLKKDSTNFYVQGISKTASGMLLLAGTYSDWRGNQVINTAYI